MKILIVDDSRAMRLIVQRTLRQADTGDHEFIEACNGAEGLKIATQGGIDLVLSDWNMPEMTGIEMLRALREAGSEVNFGFVTSESTEDMHKAAIEAGARFVITKPFTADSFRAILSAIVR